MSAMGRTLVALGCALLVAVVVMVALAERYPHNAWYYLAGGK